MTQPPITNAQAQTSPLDGAKQTAALGIRVFPVWGPKIELIEGEAALSDRSTYTICSCSEGPDCSSPAKHPIVKNWQGEATTKLPVLDAMAKRYPGCNWGMRTDDLIIIDIDPRSGGSLDSLAQLNGNLPDTQWRVNTGGGGTHLGFLPPDRPSIRGGNGALGPGLDLKARGGFVVCVGSIHVSGQRYEWAMGRPPSLADVPTWQDPRAGADRTSPDRVGGPSVASRSPHLTTGPSLEPSRSTLAGLLAQPPSVGSRNDWLTAVAGHVYRNFPHEDGAEALILQLNQSIPEPLADEEVRKIVGSIGGMDSEARDARFQEAVAKRVWTLQIQQEAQREVRATAWREPPETLRGMEYLAQPDEDEPWTIVDLLNAGGNALLAAQFKVGKTTLLLNLLRSFCDNRPFLGRFGINLEPGARVGFWNYEMPAGQFRRWIRKLSVVHPDRFAIADLRGFDVRLGTDQGDDWAVGWLRRWEVQVWIVDPYARAYSGESENDNTEVARFTDAVDRVKERAGVDICILGAHFGRNEFESGTEHVRGATRLDDWADSRWIQTRDLDGDRFFSAIGRDVDVSESRLSFNPRTLALNLVEGNRVTRSGNRIEGAIMAYVADAIASHAPGSEGLKRALSGRAIEGSVEGKATAVRQALRELERRGALVPIAGPANTVWHTVPENATPEMWD